MNWLVFHGMPSDTCCLQHYCVHVLILHSCLNNLCRPVLSSGVMFVGAQVQLESDIQVPGFGPY